MRDRELRGVSMDWQSKFETVVQVSRRELDLFESGDKECVFDKFRHPLPIGIVSSGDFPLLLCATCTNLWASGRGFQVNPSPVATHTS